MSYPQHVRFAKELDKLNKLRDFVEWIAEQQRTEGNYPTLIDDEPAPLCRLQESQKERLILEFSDISYDEFYKEKDKMVEEMRLKSDGFDATYYDPEEGKVFVKCSQCQAAAIQGKATHEHGCPNKGGIRRG